MPYAPNANWTARTNAPAHDEIYYVVIDGLTTMHFSTGPVRGASVTKKPYLQAPRSVGQNISPLQGRQSITLTDLEIVDAAGELTDLVSTDKASPTLPTLINRKVTIYGGYADLQESDYAPIAVGQIQDVQFGADGVTCVLRLGDFKRHQYDEVFRAAAANGNAVNTKLTATANAGAKQITTLTTSGIQVGDVLYVGPSTDGVDFAQEEKVEVREIQGSVLFIVNALTFNYEIGDEVRWATNVFEGKPLNIIWAVWTGQFQSIDYPLTKVRGVPSGLQIDPAVIDETKFRKERDDFLSDEIWAFEERQPTPGMRFLEQRMFRLLGFPYITIAGKLCFHVWRPEYPDVCAAGLPQILQADVLHWSWRRDTGLHVNRIELGVDYSTETGQAAQLVELEDAADVTATKERVDPMNEERTGLRSGMRGVRLAEEIEQTAFRFWLAPPPQILITCPLTKRALEIGETIELTHALVPNAYTGTRGMTKRRLLILEREEDMRDGTVTLNLMEPQYTRPAWIAPDAAPDYDAGGVTDADKEYAYIAPDAGDFADGRPPYEII